MGTTRFKIYDYAIIGLFVVVVLGVSLSWFTAFGAGVNGWDSTNVGPLAILAFVAALLAAVVVAVKALFPNGAALPVWYKEGPIVMALGGLAALFALIRVVDKPGAGGWVGYGPGGFITLITALLMIGCGFASFWDKARAPLAATHPSAPPYGPQSPAGYPGSTGIQDDYQRPASPLFPAGPAAPAAYGAPQPAAWPRPVPPPSRPAPTAEQGGTMDDIDITLYDSSPDFSLAPAPMTTASPGARPSKFCTLCGAARRSDAEAFCWKCGAKH